MDFTYEAKNTNLKLETYEWDNIWIEQAPVCDKHRIMIIGDSISCGYRRMVTEFTEGRLLADGIGTSKALDNPFFTGLIDYVLPQVIGSGIIQFNNGLHGWHLSDDEYKLHYSNMVDFLLTKVPKEKLIIALTTPVRDGIDLNKFDKRNDCVLKRNEIASEIANAKGLIINDLYETVVNKPHLWLADGVHLKEEGSKLLAEQVAEVAEKCI